MYHLTASLKTGVCVLDPRCCHFPNPDPDHLAAQLEKASPLPEAVLPIGLAAARRRRP
jgi:hypothetical protein